MTAPDLTAAQAWEHPDTQDAVARHDAALAAYRAMPHGDARDRYHADVLLPAVERMVDAFVAHGGSL